MHVRYFARIPTSNRLIKTSAKVKHLSHSCHGTCVPTRNTRGATVIEDLIFIITRKHTIHVCDVADIPRPNILIKRFGSTISTIGKKHLIHSCYVTGIPIPNRLIETRSASEHIRHSGNSTSVPRIHITFTSKLRTITKHTLSITSIQSETIISCYI